MIHEKYIIRASEGQFKTPKAHIFEIFSRKPEHAGVFPLCSNDKGWNLNEPSEPGDGRATCKICAKLAKKRGWLG